MSSLQNRHVLVLGLGLSGLAMACWCARAGARVTVADTRAQPPQLDALQADAPEARFVQAAWSARQLAELAPDVVCRSPGLKPAELAPLLDEAQRRGVPVLGELDLFVQALAQLKAQRAYAPRVLAVTGTNGKTTVTALTAELVQRSGRSAVVAGNIAPSLLQRLMQALDEDALPEVWVLELSSFQLESSRQFEPDAAALLNLEPDHLDWHGDLEAYVAAKARVFGQNGAMVLNRDDARVLALRPEPAAAPARRPRGAPALPAARGVIAFGSDVPQQPGDYGMEEVAGMSWLVRAHDDSTPGEPLALQRLMPADALRLRGQHNALNALAALALASSGGDALGPMLYGLREFRGLPHRLQSIGLLNGVEWFNDSKGTNVGATVAAVRSLGRERRLVLILGGQGKGQDFALLAAPVALHARAVVLLGEDAPLIRPALSEVPLFDTADLSQAVAQASAQAQPGDAVLFSPACASFDMFRSYEHRGELFVQQVQELARSQGNELEGLA